MPAPLLFATKDNAQGQLDANINASALSIALGSGQGALFPQPYRGTASSTGSSTTLNDTGDLGNVQLYDIIRNVTDNSWAVVTATGTNSITTTRLRGGSDNTWQSGDEWRVGEFVITIDNGDVNQEGVSAREKIRIYDRSTDTLTVPSGGRGYDGSSGQSWNSGVYVRLDVASLMPEGVFDALAEAIQYIDALETDVETNATDIDDLEDGSTHYAAAAGSSNAFTATYAKVPQPIAAGTRLVFKANHSITGAATLNPTLSGVAQGAIAIKKPDGTDVATGSIANNQVVEVVYDGTNFRMTSPLPAQNSVTNQAVVTAASSSVGSSSTSENAMTPTYAGSATIGANVLTQGSKILVRFGGNFRLDAVGSLKIRVKVGGTTAVLFSVGTASSTGGRGWSLWTEIDIRTSGGSGTAIATGQAVFQDDHVAEPENDSGTTGPAEITVDTTAGNAVTVTAEFSASDADHICNIQAGSIQVHAAP